MKKILIALVAGFIATSYGDVNVDWLATGGFYFTATPGVGILGDATGNSTFAQLIYSVDGIANDATIGGGTSGDDVVWDTKIITEDGLSNDGTQFDSYAWFLLPNNYQQTFAAGNVYARIFQDGNVQVGDWYFYTPMTALQDIAGSVPGPAGTPQAIEMNTDTLNGNPIDSGTTVAQVVPEPATFLLFGIGGIGAWLVRRNKLKSKEDADA